MQKGGYIYQYISSVAWIHLVSVLRDRVRDIPMLSLGMREDKDKGLLRWVTSLSLGMERAYVILSNQG